MPNFSIGVDLGGTNLRIAAISEQGQPMERIALNTRVTRGREQTIHEMCDAIRGLMARYRGAARLYGIGIGVPGIIDIKTGMVRESANLPDWAESPVKAQIENLLGTRVFLENDANAAALGEKWLGAARDVDDLIMITPGTGVGGGIVLGGRIWHGMTGMSGEFGHMTVEPEGPPCGCGNRGCLEQYASATALVRMAREAIASGGAPALAGAAASDPEFSARTVFELALQDDEESRKIFARMGHALGIAIANLVNAFNLPMYIVGGGLSNAWEVFSPFIFEELKRRSVVYASTAAEVPPGARGSALAFQSLTKTVVTRTLLGSVAGLFGAARLPMLDTKTA